MYNKMNLNFLSISENEAFSRNVIAAFALPANPSVSEINDVKTAVSEAVTNAIVHGYPDGVGNVEIFAELEDDVLHISVKDYGVGIENVAVALEPFYTTKEADERSGMGFMLMKTFMDELEVVSKLNEGTCVHMTKKFSK